MTEVIKCSLLGGDEFRIVGDEKHSYLEWKYPQHEWETLYFSDNDPEGLKKCVLKMHEEILELC